MSRCRLVACLSWGLPLLVWKLILLPIFSERISWSFSPNKAKYSKQINQHHPCATPIDTNKTPPQINPTSAQLPNQALLPTTKRNHRRFSSLQLRCSNKAPRERPPTKDAMLKTTPPKCAPASKKAGCCSDLWVFWKNESQQKSNIMKNNKIIKQNT